MSQGLTKGHENKGGFERKNMVRSYKIAVFPGDGIGKEIVPQALRVLNRVASKFDINIKTEEALIGGSAIDEFGIPLPEDALNLARNSDAVLLGAVGGPKWEGLDYSIRPERALLGLREKLGLYGNLRPVKLFSALVDASTLKREVIDGIDIMVIRELTGGIYFGQPRGVEKVNGEERGINTEVYTTSEIERIARLAFEVARGRNNKVCSVDKANVLESSELWRRIVNDMHKGYKDVELSHMYVDNCSMQLIRNPRQFDVVLTTNMFGDILSDEAAMLTGSIGMLPSASIGGKVAMYEPIHGSAPDIAGQNKANPIATILSVGMMFKYSFKLDEGFSIIDNAVTRLLDQGYRTPDIYSPGNKLAGTKEITDLILNELE